MEKSSESGVRALWLYLALALIIAVGTVAAVLLRQSQPEKPPGETDVTTANTTEPSAVNRIADYHGAAFKILVCNEERSTAFGSADSAPTVLSRIVGSEGRQLSDDLNLTFRVVRLASPKEYVSAAKAAGEGDTADLVVTAIYPEGMEMLSAGLLADIGDYPMLRRKAPCYDTALTDSIALGTKRFFLFGDATLGAADALRVLTVSSENADALLLTAAEGKWTLDAFHAAARTEDGALSLDMGGSDVTDWWLGAGACDAVPHDRGYTVTVGDAVGLSVIDALKRTVFGDNRITDGARFAVTTLGSYGAASDGLRAVLPMPKVDESAAYLSFADPAKATALALTSFCDDGERSATVAYYLCARTALTFGDQYEESLSRGDATQRLVVERILENRRIGILGLFDFRAVLTATLGDLCDAKNDSADLLERRIVLMQFSLDTTIGEIEDGLIRAAREN